MSITSKVGDIQRSVENHISSILNSTKVKIQNNIGTVTTGFSNVFDGGFTGMSESGMADLKTALSKYCDDVQSVIDGFDQTGDITSALKGQTQDAAYDFIAAIKELLKAYVSTMRREIDEADEAYRNSLAASQSIASDIQSSASDIRSDANKIRLD